MNKTMSNFSHNCQFEMDYKSAVLPFQLRVLSKCFQSINYFNKNGTVYLSLEGKDFSNAFFMMNLQSFKFV